jgi:hypothetical protein
MPTKKPTPSPAITWLRASKARELGLKVPKGMDPDEWFEVVGAVPNDVEADGQPP